MLAMCQEWKKQKSSLMLTRKERIAACVAELQKLEQQQERHRQEKFRVYEDFSGGALTKDAYLKQRAEIDSRLAAAKAEQEAQEQLLSELEHLAVQGKVQEDDVFTSFAGATELTAELAQTFIKEVLVSSTTEIEIVWKFRDVFDMQGYARPSPPPTGTSRPRPRNGGRRGRSFATGRWSSTDTTSASTTAVMSGRASTRYPPSI